MYSALERELEETQFMLHKILPARMQRDDVRKDDQRPMRLPPVRKFGRRFEASKASRVIIPDNGAVVRGRLQTKAGITVGLDHTSVRRDDPGACTPSWYQMYIERASRPDTPDGPVVSDEELAALEPTARYKQGAAYAAVARPARYAQQYNEHGNIELVDGRPTSFGNLGDTAPERDQYWRLSGLTARVNEIVQHRLVVELPYEVSSAERAWIVRGFCDEVFEAQGLRYWAVVHAPDDKNDSRNYHAHIVYSARPAGKILNGKRVPDNTPGAIWDFAYAEEYRSASRNLRVRFPFRQNKNRDIEERAHNKLENGKSVRVVGWIMQARERLARLNNEALRRAGSSRQYTHLGYKAQSVEKLRGPHMGPKAAAMERDGIRTAKGRDATAYQVDYYTREIAGGGYEGLERTANTINRLGEIIGQIEQRFDVGIRPSIVRTAETAQAEYLESLQLLMQAVADQRATDTLDARRLKKVRETLAKLEATEKRTAATEAAIAKFEAERVDLEARPTLEVRQAKAAAALPGLIQQAEVKLLAFRSATAKVEAFLAELNAVAIPAPGDAVTKASAVSRPDTRAAANAGKSRQPIFDPIAERMKRDECVPGMTAPRTKRAVFDPIAERMKRDEYVPGMTAPKARTPVHDPIAERMKLDEYVSGLTPPPAKRPVFDPIAERMKRDEYIPDLLAFAEQVPALNAANPAASVQAPDPAEPAPPVTLTPGQAPVTPAVAQSIPAPARTEVTVPQVTPQAAPQVIHRVIPLSAFARAFEQAAIERAMAAAAPAQANPTVNQTDQRTPADSPANASSGAPALAVATPSEAERKRPGTEAAAKAEAERKRPATEADQRIPAGPPARASSGTPAAKVATAADASVPPAAAAQPAAATPADSSVLASTAADQVASASQGPTPDPGPAPASLPAAAPATAPQLPAPTAAEIARAKQRAHLLEINERVKAAMASRTRARDSRLSVEQYPGAEWIGVPGYDRDNQRRELARLIAMPREQFLDAYLNTKVAIRHLRSFEIAEKRLDNRRKVLLKGMDTAVKYMEIAAVFQAYTWDNQGMLVDRAEANTKLHEIALDRGYDGGRKHPLLAPLWNEIEGRHESVRRQAEFARALSSAITGKRRPDNIR